MRLILDEQCVCVSVCGFVDMRKRSVIVSGLYALYYTSGVGDSNQNSGESGGG